MGNAVLIRSWLLVAAVLSCGLGPAAAPSAASAAEGESPLVTGDLQVLLRVPAWDAVVIADRLIVIDPEFLTVSAHRIPTGERLWQTRLQDEAVGRHTLHPLDDAVLVWAGRRVHVLDPATGAIRAQHDAPMNGGECGLDRVDDACAYRCDCHLQLFECTTGAPLGPRYDKTYIEEFDPDGGRSGGCFYSGGELIGRAGDVLVATVEGTGEGARSRMVPGLVAVGVDGVGGKELWRTGEIGASGFASRSGISPDDRTCWVADLSGAIDVFDCASGAPLWSRGGCPEAGAGVPVSTVEWVAEPAGIFRQCDGELTLHDPRTGEDRWTARAAAGEVALPEGAEVLPYTVHEGPRTVTLRGAAGGETVGRIELGEDQRLWSDGAGGYLVLGGELVSYSPRGVERGRVPVPDSTGNMGFAGGVVVPYQHDGSLVLGLPGLGSLGAVRGTASAVTTVHPTHLDTVAVLRRAGAATEPHEVLLLRFPLR